MKTKHWKVGDGVTRLDKSCKILRKMPHTNFNICKSLLFESVCVIKSITYNQIYYLISYTIDIFMHNKNLSLSS